jgi:hypothetical protein
VANLRDEGNEPSGSILSGKFIDQPSDYQVVSEDFLKLRKSDGQQVAFSVSTG